MVQRISQPGLESPILKQIEEGMEVFDREGNRIGDVETIYLGSVDEEAEALGQGPASTDEPVDFREDTWVEALAEAFTGDDELPEELRSRLLRHGFIRIDGSGLFAGDYYATSDQIASVSQEGVQLGVFRNELIKR